MRCDLPYRRPSLDSRFVSWFLGQLFGLGDAVEHIHSLGGKVVIESAVQQLDQQSPSRHSYSQARFSHGPKLRYCTGFHHDIKPENMLVFDDGMSAYGTIKISDFGSGKVQMLQSESRAQVQGPWESTITGTCTYEGPDMYLTGRTSRPYDMWSLGCIILEMLLWIFDTVPKESTGFATDRAQTRSEDPDTSDDGFWYVEKGNKETKVSLKPAVLNKLSLLEDEYCQGKRAFQEIILLLKDLFTIDAKERMTAAELRSALRTISNQAKRDLDQDPECYQKPAES
jgi:serine/threonine protein kinase